MKTKQEIEQLAFLEYPRVINDPYNPMEDDNDYERKIWIDAYTQCQQDMQKDVEYWQGEFDHWHQQAMQMADKKYTEEDIINIVKKSRETGLTAEYLILQLNKQD